MKSDEKISLDAIMDRLDSIEKAQKERVFLSRLDMMFSVLVSLTLFFSGLFLTSIKPVDLVTKLGFSLFASLLSLLIYTLIGEFYAIVTNHEILRFTFWMMLLQGISFLTIWGIFLTICLMPVIIILYIGLFIGIPIIIAIVSLFWFFEHLYERYIRNLCYRTIRSRSKRNYWHPLSLGLVILAISAIVAFISRII